MVKILIIKSRLRESGIFTVEKTLQRRRNPLLTKEWQLNVFRITNTPKNSYKKINLKMKFGLKSSKILLATEIEKSKQLKNANN